MKHFHIISETILQIKPTRPPLAKPSPPIAQRSPAQIRPPKQEPAKSTPFIPLKPMPEKRISPLPEILPPPPPPPPQQQISSSPETLVTSSPSMAVPAQPEVQRSMPTKSEVTMQKTSPKTFNEAAAIENLLKVGRENFLEKDYDNSLRYYNKVLVIDPDNKDANFHIKEIQYELAKGSVDTKKSSIKQSQQKGYSKPDYRLALSTSKKRSSSERREYKRISRGSLMKPLIFALLALIFIGLSLIGPWYNFSVKTEIEYMGEDAEVSSDIAYTFQEVKLDMKTPVTSTSSSTSLNDEVFEDSRAIDAIKTTNLLTILAVIMAILFFIFIIISGLKGSRKLFLVAMVFGILTIIGGFLAPIFLMTGYPAGVEADEREQWEEAKKDWEENEEIWEEFRGPSSSFPEFERSIFAESFWGSESEKSDFGSFKMTWGAGWGWYLCLIGGILAILAVIFTMVLIMRF